MTHMTQTQALAYLSAANTLPPLAKVALGFAVVMVKWSQRRRTRIALSELDPHLLRDVGLTPDQAARETAKRFWQP